MSVKKVLYNIQTTEETKRSIQSEVFKAKGKNKVNTDVTILKALKEFNKVKK